MPMPIAVRIRSRSKKINCFIGNRRRHAALLKKSKRRVIVAVLGPSSYAAAATLAGVRPAMPRPRPTCAFPSRGALAEAAFHTAPWRCWSAAHHLHDGAPDQAVGRRFGGQASAPSLQRSRTSQRMEYT
jgi:hypothetical protein